MSLPQGVIGIEVALVVATVATSAPTLKTWTKATFTPILAKHDYKPAALVPGFIPQITGYTIDVDYVVNRDQSPPPIGSYILAVSCEDIDSGDPLLDDGSDIFTDMLLHEKYGWMIVTEHPRTAEGEAASGSFKCETGCYKPPPV